MISINCDNCEKDFEVPLDDAGGKVACPFCGDINRVPPPPESPKSPKSPEAMSGESAESSRQRFSSSDEDEREVSRGVSGPLDELELTVVRPAMFRAHPFRYLIIVIAGLACLVGFFAAFFTETTWYRWPSLVVLLLIAGYFGWWWLTTHFWIKLIVTNKRSIRHEGIIRRHTTEVLHNHVRSVDINQNFLQRVFSVGEIGIDSAGQDGIEIEIADIPRPYQVKALIDKHRKM